MELVLFCAPYCLPTIPFIKIERHTFFQVRRLPISEAADAQRARLPYSDVIACSDVFSCTPRLKYAVFFFAPMVSLVTFQLYNRLQWLACSFTYQAALLFTSVSSLNLISSSSSLFVLILSTCIPSKKAKFTLVKVGDM